MREKGSSKIPYKPSEQTVRISEEIRTRTVGGVLLAIALGVSMLAITSFLVSPFLAGSIEKFRLSEARAYQAAELGNLPLSARELASSVSYGGVPAPTAGPTSDSIVAAQTLSSYYSAAAQDDFQWALMVLTLGVVTTATGFYLVLKETNKRYKKALRSLEKIDVELLFRTDRQKAKYFDRAYAAALLEDVNRRGQKLIEWDIKKDPQIDPPAESRRPKHQKDDLTS